MITSVGIVLANQTNELIEQITNSETTETTATSEEDDTSETTETTATSEEDDTSETFTNFIDDAEEWFSGFGIDVNFRDLISRVREDITNTENVQSIFGATTSAAKGLVHLLAGLLFTFYLVADGPKFRRLVLSSLSRKHRAIVLNIWDLAINKTGGYIYSRAALSVISAVFHYIAFAILDMPSPLTLAVWVGIVSQFIPAVGTYIAGIMPILVALLESPRTGLWAFIIIVLYQQIENYFFAPRITARTMQLHVAVAFGAVIVGITLLGVVGAFLALPFAATLQAWLSSWHAARTHQLDSLVEQAKNGKEQEKTESKPA